MPEHRVHMEVRYRDAANYGTTSLVRFAPGEHPDPSDVRALMAAREEDWHDLGFAHELRHPVDLAVEAGREGWENFPSDNDSDNIELSEQGVWCECTQRDLDGYTVQDVDIPFKLFVQNYLHRKGSGRRHEKSLMMQRVMGYL